VSDRVAALPERVPQGLWIEVSSFDGGGEVVLAGELDIATAPQLETALATVSGAVDVDCRSLTFIDAAGIAVLLRASKRVTSIQLHHPSAITRKLVTILGLVAVFFDDDEPQPFGATPDAVVACAAVSAA
jgi:anti-anti-sigma factor